MNSFQTSSSHVAIAHVVSYPLWAGPLFLLASLLLFIGKKRFMDWFVSAQTARIERIGADTSYAGMMGFVVNILLYFFMAEFAVCGILALFGIKIKSTY